jgi:hypothetical protein
MKFLGQVAAGRSFKNVTPTDVLQYVVDKYLGAQNIFFDISTDLNGVEDRVIRDNFKVGETARRLLNNEKIIGEVITFSSNRDTLVDVLSWFQSATNSRVWFQPSGSTGITLTAVTDSTRQYDLTPSSDDIPFVIKNNALYELSPINGVKVKGATGTRVENPIYSFNLPTGTTYTEAVATYPPLVERFDGELLKTTTSKKTDGDALTNEAAKKLKEAVDAESDGEMVTTLAPQLRPYDRVESTPACSGVTTDVPPLRYEIQEAVHSVVPSDNNLPRTEINVSMSIRPDEIETETVTKDARGGGEPSTSDSTDEYEWDYGPGAP